MPIARISLSGNQFKELVSGREVLVEDTSLSPLKVLIILSDISFGIMRHHIDDAERLRNEAILQHDLNEAERARE